jgi:hypothetical protein
MSNFVITKEKSNVYQLPSIGEYVSGKNRYQNTLELLGECYFSIEESKSGKSINSLEKCYSLILKKIYQFEKKISSSSFKYLEDTIEEFKKSQIKRGSLIVTKYQTGFYSSSYIIAKVQNIFYCRGGVFLQVEKVGDKFLEKCKKIWVGSQAGLIGANYIETLKGNERGNYVAFKDVLPYKEAVEKEKRKQELKREEAEKATKDEEDKDALHILFTILFAINILLYYLHF